MAVEPYLPQLALYASALEQATSERPAASLLFLRTGDVYTPTDADLDDAMASTRARMDAGLVLETAPSPELEDAQERYTDLS